MNLIYTISVVIIFLMIYFFIFKKITKTRYWRIKTNMNAYKKEKKEIEKEIQEMREKKENFISDENKIDSILAKIKRGEEVEIPLVAFDYIYRKIDSLSTIDENGNVRILNGEEHDEMKRTAIELLNSDERKEEIENKSGFHSENETDVYSFKNFPDGTILKKDNVTSELELITKEKRFIVLQKIWVT